MTLLDFTCLQFSALYSAAHTSRENVREEKFLFVWVSCCPQLVCSNKAHKQEFFLSHIFSWCMCSTVWSTELETCEIYQSHSKNSKMHLNFTFWIKCFCVCKWNLPSDSHMTWGCKKFCSTIIPSTHRRNATQMGSFWGHQGGVLRL